MNHARHTTMSGVDAASYIFQAENQLLLIVRKVGESFIFIANFTAESKFGQCPVSEAGDWEWAHRVGKGTLFGMVNPARSWPDARKIRYL